MWIQFNNAFLSIVENRDNKLELLVRARIKGDIEKIFPEADVFEDNSNCCHIVILRKPRLCCRS